MQYAYFAIAVLAELLPLGEGHGFMSSPPARDYAWKHFNAPDYFVSSYSYNENFCGGFGTQYNSINNGQCGICGDAHSLPRPRPHERGGKFSTGNVVGQYASGRVIDVTIKLTANHKGSFLFDICPTSNPKEWENEWCFQPMSVFNPSTGALDKRFHVDKATPIGTFNVKLQLPYGLTCSHCVLRWKYETGNNWGCRKDDPSVCCTGCGSTQEEFYSCADVMISQTGNDVVPAWVKVDKSGSFNPQFTNPVYQPPTTPWWQPPPTTRRPTTTTTTTTQRAPADSNSVMCSRFCLNVCKPKYCTLCLPRLCGHCRVYYEQCGFKLPRG